MDIKRIETLTTSELLSEGQVARLRAREVYVPDMSTAVGRLKHLRHIVENVPNTLFDMDRIGLSTACGTVGCMLGHAACDPQFIALGLQMPTLRPGEMTGAIMWDGDRTGYSIAGSLALGITQDQSHELFTSFNHPGEPQVVTKPHALARVDKLISTLAAAP